MADTYTTNLNLTKPEPGAAEDTWGISLNSDLDTLDAIFSSSGTQVNLNPNQVNFADGKKAIFGTGSDLSIYHDGGNSRILDNGTGFLAIGTNGSDIRLTGNSFNEFMAKFVQDGAVELYHNGVKKFETTSTGIDVTGTVTSDGVNTDGNVNIISGDLQLGGSTTITNNKTAYLKGVYVSDAQPTLRLTDTDATNQITDFFMSSSYALFQNRNNTANGGFIFRGSNGSVSTEYMRILPSGNIGIGTSSPAAKLDVRAADGNGISLNIGRSDTGSYFKINHAGNDLRIYNTDGTGQDILFGVDAAGTNQNNKVGIGTATPNYELTVGGSDAINSIQLLSSTTGTGATNGLRFWNTGSSVAMWNYDNTPTLFGTNNLERARIDSSGNFGVGTSSPNNKLTVSGASDGINIVGTNSFVRWNSGNMMIRDEGSYAMGFHTYDGSTGQVERMRITSAGEVLVGTTDATTPSTNAKKVVVGSTTGGDRVAYGLNVIDGATNYRTELFLDDSNATYGLKSAASAGNVAFTISQGSTEQLRVDTSGKVGIGTSSPSYLLHIDNVGGGDGIALQDTNDAGSTGLHFLNNSGTIVAEVSGLSDNTGMTFETAGSERMRITSAGNIGFGQTPVAFRNNANEVGLQYGKRGVLFSDTGLTTDIANNTYVTSSNTRVAMETDLASYYQQYQGIHKWYNAASVLAGATQSFSERMRIDASGNLLVGKTSSSTGVAGARFSANGFANVTRDGGECINFNRLTSDGTIIDLRKDSVTVGTIGTVAGYLGIANGDTGLLFRAAYDDILPYSSTANSAIDNTIDLGDPSFGFKDLYLSGSAFIDTQMRLANGSASEPAFAFSADHDTGMFRATTNELGFATGGSERARIDSSGNLLVGKTSGDFGATVGVEIRGTGNSYFTANNGNALRLNRTGTDGEILTLRKDNGTVGFLRSYAGSRLSIGSNGASGVIFGSTDILPATSGTTPVNNTYNLGSTSYKYKDLHLSGTANVGLLEVYHATTDTVANFESGDNSVAVNFTAADNSMQIATSGTDGIIKNNGAGSFRLFNNGSERARIDSSGNVGIGTSSPTAPLSIGSTGSLGAISNNYKIATSIDGGFSTTNARQHKVIGFIGTTAGGVDIYDSSYASGEISKNFYSGIFTDNSYFNSSSYRIVQGGKSRLTIKQDGEFVINDDSLDRDFRVESDNNTHALFVQGSDGSVGIGETAPSDLLHINKNQDAGTQIQIENQNTGTSSYAGLNLNGQGNNFTIKNWGDGTSKANATEFISTASGSHFIFSTQSTERVRITSNGNLLVGKSAASTTNTVGHELDNDGHAEHTVNGTTTATALILNRKNTDGSLADFRKDNTTVGTIGTNSGYIRIGTGDTHLLYHSGIDTIIPYSGSANRDNAISLGYSGARFKDIYLGGNIILSGTSANEGYIALPDSDLPTSTTHKLYHNNDTLYWNGESVDTTSTSDYRAKKDIQPLKDGLERVNKLNPVEFRYIKDDKYSEGFIAHELQEVWEHGVHGEKDGDIMQSVSYGRITPLLVKAIQEQQEQIESLKSEIAKLKGE